MISIIFAGMQKKSKCKTLDEKKTDVYAVHQVTQRRRFRVFSRPIPVFTSKYVRTTLVLHQRTYHISINWLNVSIYISAWLCFCTLERCTAYIYVHGMSHKLCVHKHNQINIQYMFLRVNWVSITLWVIMMK